MNIYIFILRFSELYSGLYFFPTAVPTDIPLLIVGKTIFCL